METNRRHAVKVGALVVIAVVLGFVILVVLGAQRLWFHDKITIHAAYPEVSGLKEGASVRLGGREVGVVTNIAFAQDAPREEALVVSMRVRKDVADRIRKDSEAHIATQGLLGDKLVDLKIGSPDQPPIEHHGWVRGVPPADPSRLLSTATEAAEKARDILSRLDRATEGMEEQGTLSSLKDTVERVNRIVARVEEGPGTVHELIYGDDLGNEAERALAKIGDAAGEVDRVVSGIKMDRSAGDLLVNASDAARGVADVANAVDKEAVARASKDVAEIVAHVKAGRGTLGGLLMDPTLYEETKRVLVNIRRNRILRTVARYVIAKEEPSKVMDAHPDAVVEVKPRSLPTRAAKAKDEAKPSRRRR